MNVEYFRKAKADFIANVLRKNAQEEYSRLNNEISLYCACFGLPVVAAVEFCEEEFPQWSEQLSTKKKQLILFYGYDE